MKRLAVLFGLLALLCTSTFAQDVLQRYHGMAEISLAGHAPIYAAMTSESYDWNSWHIIFTASEAFREWEGDALVTVANLGNGQTLVVLGGYNATIMLTPSDPAIKAFHKNGAGQARTAMTHIIVRNLPDEYVEVLMAEE